MLIFSRQQERSRAESPTAAAVVTGGRAPALPDRTGAQPQAAEGQSGRAPAAAAADADAALPSHCFSVHRWARLTSGQLYLYSTVLLLNAMPPQS